MFIVFFVYPIIYGIYTSFYKWDGIHIPEFVGLDNYSKVLNARTTKLAYKNIINYVLITVPIGMIVSFILAIIIQAMPRKWGNFFKSAYFLPSVIPLYLAASVWKWILAADVGLVNVLFSKIGLQQVAWLTDPKYMLYSLIIVDVWVSAGFNMIIMIAGINDIPESLYDAAKVDGANKFQEIINITIPQLIPTLFFTTTWGFISALQVFEAPWILTGSTYMSYGGNRNALLFPVMDMLGKGFGSLKFGQAAAYGVILAFVILFFTSIQFLINKKIKK
jgi:multiple sugar transport system permease protein